MIARAQSGDNASIHRGLSWHRMTFIKITASRLHDHAVGLRATLRAAPPAGVPHWELVCPLAFEATWNGGPRPEDIEIRIEAAGDDRPAFVQSLHGRGVLTFHSGYQFKTDPPYALWVGGPVDATRDGIAPLETLADASVLPCTVAVHWQFTRPDQTIRFAAGDAFARLLLSPRRTPGEAAFEIVEQEGDPAAHQQAFQRMVDTPALDDVLRRLGAGAEAIAERQAPPRGAASLEPGCFDTIDGRIDLGQFEPGFFRPALLLGRPREELLRRHGEVYRRDFYVIDELELVYLSVPKAACTAIKLALAKVRGIRFEPDDDVEYLVHFHPKWHREQGALRPAQEGFYRFSFVRNPFDRLVSCYRGKIIFKESAKTRVPLYQDYYFSLPVNIPFADFAERVSRIPDALADSHFKSQRSLLYADGALQVDYVGRFEQFDHDWRPIAERFGLEPVLAVANISKNKPGTHSDYRLYYTEPLVQLVYERYRDDVHTFGYEEEYRRLLEFVRERPPGAGLHQGGDAKELRP